MRHIRSAAYRVIAPMLDAREERANARIATLESQNQELRDTVTQLAEDIEMLRSDVVAVTRQTSRLVDDAR
jgi:outer membrane murein-binding lipoprotein Lpp